MKHLGTKYMETDRLILRRFAVEDGEAMYRNWASDPEVTKYLTWPPHGSPEISAMLLENWTRNYDSDDYYQWAIVPKELGQPIGSIAVVNQKEQVRSVEIGYCIGKNWWHKGIMSEALRQVMAFFFEEVGVNRVEARYDANNPNSGAVMKKCGMKWEGTLRQAGWNNQGACDECVYAMLAEEWK